mmetsp:Transcript_15934/g.52527  ORF Transcript_15934/g.52527 Transcript_15934/m.52527 type:complete len:381 (+) Transcript_15934:593-1735(+)
MQRQVRGQPEEHVWRREQGVYIHVAAHRGGEPEARKLDRRDGRHVCQGLLVHWAIPRGGARLRCPTQARPAHAVVHPRANASGGLLQAAAAAAAAAVWIRVDLVAGLRRAHPAARPLANQPTRPTRHHVGQGGAANGARARAAAGRDVPGDDGHRLGGVGVGGSVAPAQHGLLLSARHQRRRDGPAANRVGAPLGEVYPARSLGAAGPIRSAQGREDPGALARPHLAAQRHRACVRQPELQHPPLPDIALARRQAGGAARDAWRDGARPVFGGVAASQEAPHHQGVQDAGLEGRAPRPGATARPAGGARRVLPRLPLHAQAAQEALGRSHRPRLKGRPLPGQVWRARRGGRPARARHRFRALRLRQPGRQLVAAAGSRVR